MNIIFKVRSISVISVLAFALPFAANARDVTEMADFSGFSRIELDTSADLKVKIGNEFSVKMTGDQRRIDRMEFERSGDKLEISGRSRFGFFGRDSGGYIKIEITMPDLEEMEINSSGDAEISGLDNKEISLNINGSGNIYATGKSENLQIEVNGSGDIELDQFKSKSVSIEIEGSGNVDFDGGTCDKMKIDVEGSGDIDAKDFVCKEINMDISGSGNSRVYATDLFIFKGDGSCRVDVFGKPNKIEDRTDHDSKIRIR